MTTNRTRLLWPAAFLIVLVYGLIAYRLDLPPLRLGPKESAPETPGGETPSDPRGRWERAPDSTRYPLPPEAAERMERLRSLGYVSGSEPAPTRTGVTAMDPRAWYAGDNLAVSGHGPEAWLFDMTGRRLHAWSCTFREAFPEAAVPGGTEAPYYWRRAHVFPNGELLAIFEGLGLVKLDRDSRILWSLSRPVHHDLAVREDGTVWTLLREPRVIPRIHPTEPVLEDFLAVVDAEGRLLRSISLLDALERSPYRGLLHRVPEDGDLLHTNSVEWLDGSRAVRSPRFRPGHVLVSFLALDAVAVVDPAGPDVPWAATGSWKAQHEASLLDTGRILFLDNRGRGSASRVLELDPETDKIEWSYGDTDSTAFATHDCGTVARLPNGNTLITESNRGRAFEVTPAGRIVWDYTSPHRAGARKEWIATLFDVVRVPRGYWTPEFETALGRPDR